MFSKKLLIKQVEIFREKCSKCDYYKGRCLERIIIFGLYDDDDNFYIRPGGAPLIIEDMSRLIEDADFFFEVSGDEINVVKGELKED